MFYVVGLIGVFVYLALTYDPKTRMCRWRKDRSRNDGDAIYWTCDYCGAETYGDSKPPKGCLR